MRAGRMVGLALWACVCACGGGQPQGAKVPADLVLIARSVVTLEDEAPVEAIAIRNGRIAWLGAAADSGAWIGAETTVLRRLDAVVVPGLVDTHAHLSGLGKALTELDLMGTGSVAEIAERVRAAPPGEGWITGRGWDQNDWNDKGFPTHHALTAAVPNRPVALRRVDGHAVWVNRAALSRMGVDASTPDPPDGRIHRAPDGSPTGVFVDGAMRLVNARIPAPSPVQIRGWIQRAVEKCHQVGLTGVHDAGVDAVTVEVYRELAAAGALPLRVYAMLDGDDPDVEPLLDAGPKRGEFLTVAAVKLFADGALGSRGAWLSAPYADAPGESGIPILRGAALREKVKRAHDAGFQVGVHAIGDRAVTEVLDAFEAVMGTSGAQGGARPRVEHAQVVRPADRERMARLGALAMMQPTHATSDMPWAEARLGPDRIQWAYAWQALRAAGVRVPLGSDFPVERPDVLDGLYSAITRADRDAKPAGGWMPSQRLTPEQALVGFTEDAAFAGRVEHRRGRLKVGLDADLTLLSADPRTESPAELRALRVLGVVVAGVPHGPFVGR